MKKKIAILGSTGSIGKSTLEIIKKDKKNFDVVLLSTNKNIPELLKQQKIFKPKYLIINDFKSFIKFKKKNKSKIKVFNDYNFIKKIFKKKIDYTMCSISGFDGLKPILDIIPFTKIVAIANKESLICGWNLLHAKIKRYNTKFIPVDSEHFSIWSLIKNASEDIDKIYITASGGPFLNKKANDLKKIKPEAAIKHPNWKMGKKISIDSATLINKVFEVIEAKKIFNLNLNQFEILLHPDSYVHAIVKFKNGLTKILIHDTDMKIPIFNSIYFNEKKEYTVSIDNDLLSSDDPEDNKKAVKTKVKAKKELDIESKAKFVITRHRALYSNKSDLKELSFSLSNSNILRSLSTCSRNLSISVRFCCILYN